LVNALKRGDCGAAVKLVNPLVNSNDEQTSFIAGRMLSPQRLQGPHGRLRSGQARCKELDVPRVW
jgi:hypothetical protein